jgi:hypothetical protein
VGGAGWSDERCEALQTAVRVDRRGNLAEVHAKVSLTTPPCLTRLCAHREALRPSLPGRARVLCVDSGFTHSEGASGVYRGCFSRLRMHNSGPVQRMQQRRRGGSAAPPVRWYDSGRTLLMALVAVLVVPAYAPDAQVRHPRRPFDQASPHVSCVEHAEGHPLRMLCGRRYIIHPVTAANPEPERRRRDRRGKLAAVAVAGCSRATTIPGNGPSSVSPTNSPALSPYTGCTVSPCSSTF